MQRFQNILVLTGGEESAGRLLERAAALARRNRARLTVAGVVDALPRDMQPLVPAIDIGDLVALALEEMLAQIEPLVEPERQKGLEIETRALCGTPFLEVIRAVLRDGHDLVMTTAGEQGASGGALSGGTTMHLLRKCPCPVWVVSPAQRHSYARVMAAVDPATPDDAHQSLNIKILQLATSLARIEGSELHVVHAWLPVGERLLIPRWRLPDEKADALAQHCAAAHQRAFEDLLAKAPLEDLRVQVHLVKGDAGEAVPALARSKHAGVVVMGTVCRTGIPGLFIGNTAERILRRVDCSVLTVKPEGFATPVKLE